MNNQWNTPIDKLMLWSGNGWSKYVSNAGKTSLRMHYDQLMVLSGTNILESFNMNCKMRGIFKQDVLILIVSTAGQEIRKLRFQIKGEVEQCLRTLREHFPVMGYGPLQSKNAISVKYRNIDEILKYALDNKEPGVSVPLPCDYEKFVKLCLLDPAFPQYVTETMKIFQKDIN